MKAADPAFAVIAHSGLSERHLSLEELAQIYLRQRLFWGGGQHLEPVNLPLAHPLRRAFSQAVLGQPPEALESYWRQMYFHGTLPPHVLESEEAVLLFVSVTPGALGYVSSCIPTHGVTVLLVVGDMHNCSHP